MASESETMRVTAVRARELLSYDPETGTMTWNSTIPTKRREAGVVAGSVNCDGYMLIQVDGRKYSSHRLAWLITHGTWPTGHIDHINGDKLDNRMANLRSVSVRMNAENQKKSHQDNSTGFLGVSFKCGSYRAQIQSNGRKFGLGTYPTPEAAHQAYLTAKMKLHEGTIP